MIQEERSDMPKLFADLHCHCTMYGFNRMRNTPEIEQNPEKFNPWTPLPENYKHMAAGSRGATYSQSDMPKLAKAKGRLMFASITPIEKEFFGYAEGDERHHYFLWELLLLVTMITPIRVLFQWLRGDKAKALKTLTAVLRNHSPLRAFVQKLIMGYSPARIKHLQSDKFDYWDEYLREYEFYKNKDGIPTETRLTYAMPDGSYHEERLTGCYHLIKERSQLMGILDDPDNEEIGIVLTIEGSHVTSIDPKLNRVPEDVLFERIESLKTQPHPIFFITLAHHFDNGLCGHAHSVPGKLSMLLDQSHRMNEGFVEENDLGLRAARAYLDLDEDLEPLGGRRILLDIKHMSALTRQQYYEKIIRPYRAKWKTWSEDKQARYPAIPLVASHACYSGIRTLDEMQRNVEKEDDHWHAPPFNAWNINLSDEDMVEVFESRGVVGICFEQRIAGVAPKQHVHPEQYAYLILQHVIGLVDAVYQDESRPLEERKKVWDCICLGTDYDGFIDPVTAYPTVLSLDEWAEDLRRHLQAISHTRSIGDIGVDELVEKIAWRNAYDFVKANWPVHEDQK